MPSTGVTIAVCVFALGAAFSAGFVGWIVWSCIREPPTMTYAEALGLMLEGAKARRIERGGRTLHTVRWSHATESTAPRALSLRRHYRQGVYDEGM